MWYSKIIYVYVYTDVLVSFDGTLAAWVINRLSADEDPFLFIEYAGVGLALRSWWEKKIELGV